MAKIRGYFVINDRGFEPFFTAEAGGKAWPSVVPQD